MIGINLLPPIKIYNPPGEPYNRRVLIGFEARKPSPPPSRGREKKLGEEYPIGNLLSFSCLPILERDVGSSFLPDAFRIAQSFERNYGLGLAMAQRVFMNGGNESAICLALLSGLSPEQVSGYRVEDAEKRERLKDICNDLVLFNKLRSLLGWFGKASYDTPQKYLQNYLNMFLKLFSVSKNNIDLVLFAYLVEVLERKGLSRFTEIFCLSVDAIRLFLAFLIEMQGYDKLAEELRNSVLRFLKLEGVEPVRPLVERKIEETLGMTYFEAQTHLINLKRILEEALSKGLGLREGEFRVSFRVKTPYSALQKIADQEEEEYKKIEQLRDLLGVKIIVNSDRTLWLAVNLLERLFKGASEISGVTRDQRRELFELFEGRGISERREIRVKGGPRDGELVFVNLTLFDYDEKPVEFRVATFERDRLGRRGEAAHCLYKLRREIRAYLARPRWTCEYSYLSRNILRREEIKALSFDKLPDDEYVLCPCHDAGLVAAPKGTTVEELSKKYNKEGEEIKVYCPDWDYVADKPVDRRVLELSKEDILQTGWIVAFGVEVG